MKRSAVVALAGLLVASSAFGQTGASPPAGFPWLTLAASLLATAMTASIAIFFGLRGLRLNIQAHDRATNAMNEAQAWKRKEFVAAWFERLRGDELAQTAMLVLDQSDVRVRTNAPQGWKGGLKEDVFAARDSEHFFRVGSRKTFMALVPHGFTPGRRIAFSDEHMFLKRCFDALFNRLGQLQAMETAGLLTYEDIKPYIDYWMELLAGVRKSVGGEIEPVSAVRAPIFSALKLYLHAYGFSDVMTLGKRFGQELMPTEADREEVRKQLEKIRPAANS